MELEINNDEVNLLTVLLNKELEETRVEINHAENAGYKEHLKSREEEIRVLLVKVAPELKEALKEK